MTWPMVKIKDIFDVARGGSPRPIDAFLTDAENGVNWIMIGDTKEGGKYIEKTAKKIKPEGVKNSREVKEGDFLLTNSMSFGRPYILKTSGCIHDGWLVLSPRTEKIHKDYFYYYLGSKEIKSTLASKAAGAVVKNLNKDIVKELEIPLPPLEEQKRIAEIMDKADAIRQKRQQAISLADDFLRSIFLEMFIRAADNWTVKTIEYIADKGKGGLRTGPFGSHLLHSEFVDSGIPVLGIDNAVENSFKWGKARFITEEKYKSLSRYTVHPGDVLITIMGTCGRCAVVPDDIPTAINTKHLCCISLDYKKALPEFLHSYYLFHPMSRQYLAKVTKGAIMDGLNMGLIKTMPFPMVPIKLQEKYVEIKMNVLSSLDKQHLSESYQEDIFNSLSQQFFVGKCLTA
ncbi:MAG: restriction endonuclease subunit S [Aeromonas veronii]